MSPYLHVWSGKQNVHRQLWLIMFFLVQELSFSSSKIMSGLVQSAVTAPVVVCFIAAGFVVIFV